MATRDQLIGDEMKPKTETKKMLRQQAASAPPEAPESFPSDWAFDPSYLASFDTAAKFSRPPALDEHLEHSYESVDYMPTGSMRSKLIERWIMIGRLQPARDAGAGPPRMRDRNVPSVNIQARRSMGRVSYIGKFRVTEE